VDETLKLGGSWSIDASALDKWLGVEATRWPWKGSSRSAPRACCWTASPVPPSSRTLYSTAECISPPSYLPARRCRRVHGGKGGHSDPIGQSRHRRRRRLDLSQEWAAVQQGAAGGAQGIKELAARGSDWLSTLPDLNISRRTLGSSNPSESVGGSKPPAETGGSWLKAGSDKAQPDSSGLHLYQPAGL